MISFSNPFTLRHTGILLQRLDARYPKIYLGIAAMVTAIGYFALALVPILLLTAVLKITSAVGTASTFGAWLGILVWLLVAIATATQLFAMLRVRSHMPAGLGLKEDKAPRLYELLEEMRARYDSPKIHRIIMHDKGTLELVPVPRFGLPILKVNVLYIGLPVMQCLSPTQFRGLMARRLAQYAARDNKLTHWIYRFRQYCQQYRRFYRKQKGSLYQPLRWFFKLYTPVLEFMTAAAARRDELYADRCVLEIMNDEELADMIIRYEVSGYFLKARYWPKIFSMLRRNPDVPEHTPHISMARVLRNTLTEEKSQQIMQELMSRDAEWNEINPALHTRLDNIGKNRINMPPPVMETAAQRYLGNAFGAVLKLLDKQWLARYSSSSKTKKEPSPTIPDVNEFTASTSMSDSSITSGNPRLRLG